MKFSCGLQQHPWFGFAAITIDLQFCHFAFIPLVRVMGTIIQAIDVGALLPQQGLHLVMDFIQLRYRYFSPCNHRLVGHYNAKISRCIDFSDGLRYTRQQFKCIYIAEKANIFIDNAVSVKKNRLLPIGQIFCLHPARQNVRLHLTKALRRSHILYILGAVIAEHLAGPGQRLEQLTVQIHFECFSRGRVDCPNPFRVNARHLQYFRRHHMEPCIHPVFIVGRSCVFFGKPLYHGMVFVCNQQAAVVWMAVGMGKQGNQAAVGPVKSDHPVEVHIKNRIGIQKEKVFCQLPFQSKQRTSIPQRPLFAVILNGHPQPAAVP